MDIRLDGESLVITPKTDGDREFLSAWYKATVSGSVSIGRFNEPDPRLVLNLTAHPPPA